jgi:hypothetical protein
MCMIQFLDRLQGTGFCLCMFCKKISGGKRPFCRTCDKSIDRDLFIYQPLRHHRRVFHSTLIQGAIEIILPTRAQLLLAWRMINNCFTPKSYKKLHLHLH